MHTNTKRGLIDHYCAGCDTALRYTADDGKEYSRIIGVEYSYDSSEHYDGVSEWRCLYCGRREGRWSGKVLTGDEIEPRWGGNNA